MRLISLALSGALIAVGSFSTATASAESVSDFYKGKTITVQIGNGPGGGYDTYARAMARNIARHIPGKPTTIAVNMPGAGGLKSINHAYNIGARDGTLIFSLNINLPMYQAMGGRGVKYDAGKFIGLGRLTHSNELIATWHTSPVKIFADALKKQAIIGSSGASSNSSVYPMIAVNMLGAKFKVITGYKGSSQFLLAMERGELDGFGSMSYASLSAGHPNYLKDNLINGLYQVGFDREKVWSDVPTLIELAPTPDEKTAMKIVAAGPAIGRSYMLLPEVPAERVKALRAAFRAMLSDPAFLKEAKRLKMVLRPATGKEVEAIIASVLESPPQAINILHKVILRKGLEHCELYSKVAKCRKMKKKKDS